MSYFSSDVFKISLFLIGFLAVYGVVLYLTRNRIIRYMLGQPDDKRARMSQGLSRVVHLCKIVFWLSPLLLVSPLLHLLVKNYDSFLFEISSLTIVYMGFLEVFLFFNLLLRVLSKNPEAS